jgi:acylphosphatase
MTARRYLITGRVQGVGFRHAMAVEARHLGLSGWVRNRGYDSVEAVASGEAAALDALERWARRGPPAARVFAVDVRPATTAEAADLDPGFSQRPSA